MSPPNVPAENVPAKNVPAENVENKKEQSSLSDFLGTLIVLILVIAPIHILIDKFYFSKSILSLFKYYGIGLVVLFIILAIVQPTSSEGSEEEK